MPLLPKYADCEYSLFISYAHYDDKYENRWVSQLKAAIFERISGGLPRQMPRRGIHYSQENGSTAGHLSAELERRVRRSFGMLLVVGKNYVESEWCERELELFARIFGDQGSACRLFIAAMSEEALKQASGGAQWKKYLTDDQVWVPMYQPENPTRPLRPRASDGGFADDFFEKISRIADRLIEEIAGESATSRLASAGVGVIEPVVYAQPDSAQVSAQVTRTPLRIALAPTTTPELRTRAEALQETLTKVHADCFWLDRELLDRYDPEEPASVEALRAELSRADVLVAPFLEVTPLPPVQQAGGHLGVLSEQWRAIGKRQSPVWYRPFGVALPKESAVAQKHLEFFRNLAPLCESDEAVLSLLFGPDQAEVIKVCVENHPTEKVYETLIDKMDELWAACLAQEGESRPLRLRCRPLDLDRLDEVPNDVSGVVLILPLGVKSKESLRSQIAAVEKAIPKASAGYPGRVALVFSPPPDKPAIAEHDWPHVQCRKARDKNPLDLDLRPDGELELQAFLGSLLRRYRKANPVSGTR